MKRTRFILGVFGTIGLLTCVGVCCFLYLTFGNSYSICFGTLFPSSTDVEQHANLKFPPSAQNIEFYANGINRKAGCTIWVKFEMDSQDLDAFITTTHIRNLNSSIQLTELGDAFSSLSEQQGWRQTTPSLAGNGSYYFDQPRWTSEDQWIFINTINSEKWVVYLITNQEWL